MIKLIVADDHPIFRDGLVRSISETGEFDVVGVGACAQDAIDLAADLKPDVALLDLSMPGSGLTAAARIVEAKTAGFVAMLTVSEDDADDLTRVHLGGCRIIIKRVLTSLSMSLLKRITP